jgi:hypothetical protein
MKWELTGRPLHERIMASSVEEKTKSPDDFAETYLLLTNLLMDSGSWSFMATEMREGGRGRMDIEIHP